MSRVQDISRPARIPTRPGQSNWHSGEIGRRQFLTACGGALAGSVAATLRGEDPQPAKNAAQKIVEIDVDHGTALQSELDRHVGSGSRLRLKSAREITCLVQEQIIGGEKSIHPLLIPAGVHLDLQGSTLQLDCRSNSYGVRLSNDSSISNGSIRIVRSEGKGSQACWHSGISIGAAYDDAGTPEKPGRFSTVRNWLVENITIDQPFAASAIQLMSEACHGAIRNVTILDSAKALLGVGMDWGSVGPITTEDAQIPRMRKLWEAGKIYSTHPHDVLVENLKVGRLTRHVDGNDAGVRCSACHNITIRNVMIAEAATAVAIFGGDLGYEFAREDQRKLQHIGYRIEDVQIERAEIYGLVLNGSADNVYRASRNHAYRPVRDPVHPGLDRPVIKNLTLRGGGDRKNRQGIYAVAVTDARLESMSIEDFDIGVHVEDWVRGMRFVGTRFAKNRKDTQIEGATEAATGVVFETQRRRS
jgi:hypothetical protein